MIGARAAASVVAAMAVGIAIAPSAPEPGAAIASERLVRDRAGAAMTSLDALREAVEPGLDAARHAAAEVLTGDEPPGPALVAAAEAIAAAEGDAVAARRAVAALDGARRALDPGLEPLAEPVASGELESIGGQLAATAGAADDFAELRRLSTDVPAVLERAVLALERGDLDAARARVAEARAAHDRVAAWESAPSTVVVWLTTTDAMIGAMEDLIAATLVADDAAAQAAAARFAGLADAAATADRALRIGLSEGGAAVTATPVERLAGALRGVETTRQMVAAIAEGAGS